MDRIQSICAKPGGRHMTSGGKEQTPDRSKFARQFRLALRTFGGSDGILTINEIETFLEKGYPIPPLSSTKEFYHPGILVNIATRFSGWRQLIREKI